MSLLCDEASVANLSHSILGRAIGQSSAGPQAMVPRLAPLRRNDRKWYEMGTNGHEEEIVSRRKALNLPMVAGIYFSSRLGVVFR